ncbi:MAG TPA: IclR family transcriptional regulator [Bacillota bacterium]|nr:IclR family transcriptional regulator [Bacillota bacterium]
MPTEEKGSLTARRTGEILLLFLENEKLTLSDIARMIGISKTSAYRMVTTLADMNFLKRDDAKRYHLGYSILSLSRMVEQNIRIVAAPIMKELAAETGESVYLSISNNCRYYYFIEGVESGQPLKWAVNVGEPNSLLAGSAGKAHVAFREKSEAEEIVKKAKLVQFTKNTIVDKNKLIEELAKIRTQGYSFSWGERYEEAVGISCPVWDFASKRNTRAILSIFVPKFRYSAECLSLYSELLKKASKKIFLLSGG